VIDNFYSIKNFFFRNLPTGTSANVPQSEMIGLFKMYGHMCWKYLETHM